jgi:hypothetical protein
MKINLKKLSYIITAIVLIIVIFGVGLFFWAEKNRQQFCFYRHLSDAVKVNNKRKLYYSEITNGISESTSNNLIRNERMLMFMALWLDIRAQKFIKKGIPIVCNDFVEMSDIENKEEKPFHANIVNESVFERLNSDFEKAKTEMRKYNQQNDFRKVGDIAHDLLLNVENIEKETKSNFCMTRHVIDSLGIAAVHASKYSNDSQGEIDSFAQSFVGTQVSGLSNSILDIDRGAQKAHQLGVGIVCNDVPKIPFKEEYENNL